MPMCDSKPSSVLARPPADTWHQRSETPASAASSPGCANAGCPRGPPDPRPLGFKSLTEEPAPPKSMMPALQISRWRGRPPQADTKLRTDCRLPTSSKWTCTQIAQPHGPACQGSAEQRPSDCGAQPHCLHLSRWPSAQPSMACRCLPLSTLRQGQHDCTLHRHGQPLQPHDACADAVLAAEQACCSTCGTSAA